MSLLRDFLHGYLYQPLDSMAGLIIFSFTITALLLGAIHYWKQAQQVVNRGYYRGLKQQLNRIEREAKEASGLVMLSRYNDPFPLPFGGGWAMCADSAQLLARLVWENRPNLILGLGSGVSTLLCAKITCKVSIDNKLYKIPRSSHRLVMALDILKAVIPELKKIKRSH